MPGKLNVIVIIHVHHTQCEGVLQRHLVSTCLTSAFLQTSGIGHISEIHLCGAGCDVRDGFYQFSNYRLADYFALRFKVRACDFGVTAVYDPETDGVKICRTQRTGVASC